MFYKKGKVISKGKSYILFESNNTGYVIYVSLSDAFKKDENIKLYTYVHRSEFSNTIYGFRTFEERILFEDLLTISGVGPKTAIQLLKIGVDQLIDLIVNENTEAIQEIPYIGKRTASIIVFELKNKYTARRAKAKGLHSPIEIKKTLKSFGFKQEQIEFAISRMKPSDSLENMVEDAIKLISNENQHKTTNV